MPVSAAMTGAPVDYAYLGFGTDATLTAEVDIQGFHLTNEFRNWPTYTPIDTDLAAGGLWYDSIGTPTTAPTQVDVAGEAGITETWEYAIKCVADAAAEGWEQVYTYADEHRIKAGKRLSGLFAIWVVTAGSTVTVTFRNSTGETTTGTATAQAWTVVEVANHLLVGNSVDVEFTINAADTFYVVPLGLCIGTRGVALPPRAMAFIEKSVANVVNNVDPGGAGWVDVDLTANASGIATGARLNCQYTNTTTAGTSLRMRRNGDSASGGATYVVRVVGTAQMTAQYEVMLDDSQIFEYTTGAAAGDAESVYVHLQGYLEWA